MASIPEFRSTHCTRFRFRYSECRRCADTCHYGAVALSEEGIRIDPVACRHCTLCVAACPTEAIQSAELPRIDLLKRIASRSAVTIACAPSGLKGDEVVPCLGALDTAMLAHLSSRGVKVELAGTQKCSACAHGEHATRQLELQMDGVAVLREATAAKDWQPITLSAAPASRAPQAEHNAGRRHLFRRLIGRGVDQIAKPLNEGEPTPAPLKAIRFARQFSTAGRELLQAVLDKGGDDAQTALPAHPAIFAAQIDVPNGCTACEACARACPTNAIQVKESAVGWELAFESARCVGCGVCTEACQPRVLHLSQTMHNWKSRPASVLHARAKQRCGRCDRFFISPEPEEICEVCEGDDRDFASLFG
ncbi:4Fe-4S dicluster domain-containing protein [Noviherbaspirillum sp. ST9]|uniref:NADH-quinone oxidoreductase subunit I n=1 Tax=Noviherbaspirillum sp. ST9 TaxID=3401606 RepID=UPI003B58B1CE